MKAIPITDPKKSEFVHKLLEADNHQVPCCNYTLECDDGEIFGAFSTVYAPLLFIWINSKRQHPVAAHRAWKAVEDLWRDLGHRRIVTCTNPSSRFNKWLEVFDYRELGECILVTKTL